jgi:hypothetical protein
MGDIMTYTSETIVHDCGGIPDCHCGVGTATICRTCGFSHPEADCPRWPAREPTAAQTYDTYLLNLARELAALSDTDAMRAWLAGHGTDTSREDQGTVYARILGRTQAALDELTRWVERIPEAHRG